MRSHLVVAVLLALASASLARADTPESPLDSAQRLGPHTSVASFTEGALADRLRAIRGAPFGPAPETSLAALVAVAAGRDPSAAPTAAVAVLRTAERLDHASLDAREADFASIEQATRALRALASDRSARADIRRLADLAATDLSGLRAR